MGIMHLYKIQQNFFLKQVLAALVLFTMLSLYGGDMIKTIERLDGRPYVRNNTWNGCCVFDTVGNTSFQVEDFSKEEWMQVIETTVKPQFVDINKQAFTVGYAS